MMISVKISTLEIHVVNRSDVDFDYSNIITSIVIIIIIIIIILVNCFIHVHITRIGLHVMQM